MDHSDLVNSLLDMVGPRIDPELARKLDAAWERVLVRRDEPSLPTVVLFESEY